MGEIHGVFDWIGFGHGEGDRGDDGGECRSGDESGFHGLDMLDCLVGGLSGCCGLGCWLRVFREPEEKEKREKERERVHE
jgi:hypothetical protein